MRLKIVAALVALALSPVAASGAEAVVDCCRDMACCAECCKDKAAAQGAEHSAH